MERWGRYVENCERMEHKQGGPSKESITYHVKRDERGNSIPRLEFDKAMEEMNAWKAVGLDGIAYEFLKNAEVPVTSLFELICRMYEESEGPKDFPRSIRVMIHKKAGTYSWIWRGLQIK